jgi:N-acetyldiaminopimelate deacetylase
MGSCDEMDISFSSDTHEGDGAVQAAAAFILAAQTIVSRNVAPIEPAVVTFGKITSEQTARSDASDLVCLQGTVRTFDDGVRALILRRLSELGEGVAATHRVKFQIRWLDSHYPPLVNRSTIAHCSFSSVSASCCLPY